MIKKPLILGCGYVGNALLKSIPDAYFTHRTVEKAQVTGGIYFNLEDPDSWHNLPTSDTVIWTFPAKPLKLVKEFHQQILTNSQKLFIYASTSCYLTTEDDELVTEINTLNHEQERVAGEEFLREKGATILALAGIYGENRVPENWLRSGRIRSLQKRVNLIHCDDIVSITNILLQHNDLRFKRINITDGESLQWESIADFYGIEVNNNAKPTVTGKRVSNAKLRALLPDNYQFNRLLTY